MTKYDIAHIDCIDQRDGHEEARKVLDDVLLMAKRNGFEDNDKYNYLFDVYTVLAKTMNDYREMARTIDRAEA